MDADAGEGRLRADWGRNSGEQWPGTKPPGLPGPGDLSRGRLSHLGTSFGLGPDSRCRVADLHAPVLGIALGWRRQGENEIEREEEKREKNCSAWKCRCMVDVDEERLERRCECVPECPRTW